MKILFKTLKVNLSEGAFKNEARVYKKDAQADVFFVVSY
jgi:hypothetical protein